MKIFRVFSIIIALLSALLISSCDGLMTAGTFKTFDSKLRGTWVSNDPGLYSGSLKITSDTITIDGYGEDQTPLNGDDSKRPFKDFPKGVAIKGYSEDGKIFIDIDWVEAAQNGITYSYLEGGTYPQNYKLLKFSFGDRIEILQSQ